MAMYPLLIDKKNTWYFAKKPEVGGMPAKDINKTVLKTASQGFALYIPLKMGSSSSPFDARFIKIKMMNNGMLAIEYTKV